MFENRSIGFLVVGFFFLFAGFGSAQQYATPLLQVRGQASLAVESLVVLYTVFLFAGFWGPKMVLNLGSKRALLIGGGMYPLYPLALASGNRWLIYLGGAAVGVGATLLWNSAGQVVAFHSSKEHVGYNQGAKFTALQVGGLLGTILGGWYLTSLPSGWIFFSYGLTCLIGVSCFAAVKDAYFEGAAHGKFTFSFSPKLWLVLLPLIAAAFQAFITFTAVKLDILQRFDLGFVGVVATVIRIFGAIGALGSGSISDRLAKSGRELPLLYFLIACGVVGAVCYLEGESRWVVLFGSALGGLGFAATPTVVTKVVYMRAYGEEFDLVLGAFNIVNTVGAVAGLVAAELLPLRVTMEIPLYLFLGSFIAVFVFSFLAPAKERMVEAQA